MAWVGCISVDNHNWSYEPRMRTVRLMNKETAKRNLLKQNFGIDSDGVNRFNQIKTPVLLFILTYNVAQYRFVKD